MIKHDEITVNCKMTKDEQRLNTIRVMRKKHIVNYANSDNTLKLSAHYKGQTPIRAYMSDTVKMYESGILLDHIQLVVFQNDLKIVSFEESDFYIKGEK